MRKKTIFLLLNVVSQKAYQYMSIIIFMKINRLTTYCNLKGLQQNK